MAMRPGEDPSGLREVGDGRPVRPKEKTTPDHGSGFFFTRHLPVLPTVIATSPRENILHFYHLPTRKYTTSIKMPSAGSSSSQFPPCPGPPPKGPLPPLPK
ncbi:hypothetical protein VTN00DRAFT_676 [Thermoascus crustaceus]|uniref:uncharacterized protein n=1 Tax=Thermoascus crustaceus TaxID=5088 RepID=UPI00374398EE